MQSLKLILKAFSSRERFLLSVSSSLFLITLIAISALTIQEKSVYVPVRGGAYAEGVIGQPIMINPILSDNQTDQDLSALLFSNIFDLLSDTKSSEDGREYTVKLKQNLMWDDGKPLTTDDLLFTIQTIQNPAARSPFAKDWQGVSVERVSQLQVNFSLPTPYVFFIENLKRTRIIPKHIFGAIPVENINLSSYTLEPVGNGPYKFEGFSKRKDGFITEYNLVTNPFFAGTPAYIEHFSFRFYTTLEELAKDLKLRRVQGFGNTLPISTEIGSLPRTISEAVSMPRYYAIFMNAVNNPILKDKNLRVALAMAIDKEKIIKEVFRGNARAINSPIFSELASFGNTPEATTSSSQGIAYDPETAARTIASLKTKDIVLNLVIPEIPFLEKTAELIKEDWLAAGIKEVTIFPLSIDVLTSDAIKTRNYDLLLFGNIYENPGDLFPFWHSSQRFYPGLNLSLYQNTEVDRFIETVRQKSNVTTEQDGLRRLNTLITNDAPAVFLFSTPYFYTHTTNLGGFAPGFITAPSDRFREVQSWYVTKARVLKSEVIDK
ncbi:MAG: ABC transporter substrate-binding protein [Candidatus Paceibacterota bacterium]|jgi:peptide/nickel transport system substrate-binding protein